MTKAKPAVVPAPEEIAKMEAAEEVAQIAADVVADAPVKGLDTPEDSTDEKIRQATDPKGRFVVVELKGNRYRVMNKRKQWVSPAVSSADANRLCARLNQKDPEQKPYNRSTNRAQGIWTPDATL